MTNEEEMHNILEWFKLQCGVERVGEATFRRTYNYCNGSSMKTELCFFEHLPEERQYVIVRTSTITGCWEDNIEYAVLKTLNDVIKFTEKKLKEYRKLDSLIFK